jgi:hypothetical protein
LNVSCASLKHSSRKLDTFDLTGRLDLSTVSSETRREIPGVIRARAVRTRAQP